jgi:hypothetical protein
MTDLLRYAVATGAIDWDDLPAECEQNWQYFTDDHHLVRFEADAALTVTLPPSGGCGSATPTPGRCGHARATRCACPVGIGSRATPTPRRPQSSLDGGQGPVRAIRGQPVEEGIPAGYVSLGA